MDTQFTDGLNTTMEKISPSYPLPQSAIVSPAQITALSDLEHKLSALDMYHQLTDKERLLGLSSAIIFVLGAVFMLIQLKP